MGEFRKLRVWNKAHALSVDVDQIAKRIRGGVYAPLRSQMVRAAMSIPANLAEGCVQKSQKDFGRFVGYSIGSAAELENHLQVASDIKAISEADYRNAMTELTGVRMMLHGLSKRLKEQSASADNGSQTTENDQRPNPTKWPAAVPQRPVKTARPFPSPAIRISTPIASHDASMNDPP